MDILADAVGGGLYHVRALDVQLLAVVKEGVGVEFGDVHDGLVLPAGPGEHFVLPGVRVGGQVAHVGDVHHPVHLIALIAQEFLQHVLGDVGAQVADVGVAVDGGAAGVHLHPAGDVGFELPSSVGGGIVKIHGVVLLGFICCHAAPVRDAVLFQFKLPGIELVVPPPLLHELGRGLPLSPMIRPPVR